MKPVLKITLTIALNLMVAALLEASPGAKVTAALDTKDKENVAIEFRFQSTQNLVIFTSSLPWKQPLDLAFTVIPLMGTELKRFYPINDPSIGDITLQKGKLYKGNLRLSNYFPDIARAHAKQDLIFFWYWTDVKDLNDTQILNTETGTKEFGGWVFIPRRK